MAGRTARARCPGTHTFTGREARSSRAAPAPPGPWHPRVPRCTRSVQTQLGCVVMAPSSPVAVLCIRPAVEATSDLSIGDAVRRMRDEGVSSLLLDGGRAIVTERDVARAVAFGCDVSEPVGWAALPPPVSAPGSVCGYA